MRNATIAVVDDDEAALDSFAVLLELDGHKVSTFDDGARFLDEYPSLLTDCVLLDIRMPNLDGFGVLERLQAAGDTPPVILMTASPKLLSQNRAQRLGAITVLEKPIEEASLLSAVRMALAMIADGQTSIRNNTYT